MNEKVIASIFFIGLIAIALGIAEFVSLKKQPSPAVVVPQPQPIATTTPPAPAKFDLGGCDSIAPSAIANTISQQTNGFSQDSYIQTSTQAGWNFIFVSDARYCLLYPSDWQVRVAGAYGNNLMFNEPIATGTRQMVFLQGAYGGFPLEQADKSTAGAGDGEIPAPLVDPAETIIHKEIETIGNKQVLFESSKNGTTIINRYFLGEKGVAAHVFQSSVPGAFASSANYATFLSTLKQVVSSMQFVQ